MQPDWCYISSGTWSLLGVEVSRPIINDKCLALNFTNEGGVGGTTRLLKEHLRLVAGAGVPTGVERRGDDVLVGLSDAAGGRKRGRWCRW